MSNIGTWYRQHRRDPSSDIAPHFDTFARLVVEHRVRHVLELGVRAGHSTAAWLHFVGANGHVWSIDVDPAPYPPQPSWTFIQGNDVDPNVVAQTPEVVDLLFIDTSHDYEHTRAELSLYGPKVRDGGVIVLHDTANEKPWEHNDSIAEQQPFPVLRAMQEYAVEHGSHWTTDPRSWGLGVIFV